MKFPREPHEKRRFCMAPWTHLHVWPNGRVFPCCYWDSLKPIGQLSEGTSLTSIWNNESMKELRLAMLEDRSTPECGRCYAMDEAGLQSQRAELNANFGHHRNVVESTETDGSVRQLNIAYMDIRFSNLCNFRCRTCGPELSSGWYEDARKTTGLVGFDKVQRPVQDIDSLMREVEAILPHVEEIYFAGGEPLISDEHFRIMELLTANARFDVKLVYNTNFSTISHRGRNIFDFWKRFKHVNVGASLDGMGEKGEYVRKGQKWEVIERNRRAMLAECPDASFFVNFTLSVFNFLDMPEFHRDWTERGLIHLQDWNINPVTYPRHYSVHVAPEELRRKAVGLYEKHLETFVMREGVSDDSFIARRWKGAIQFLGGPTLDAQTRSRFVELTRSLDSIREESFERLFPDLAVLMNVGDAK